MLPSPDILNDFEHGRFVLSNLAAKRAKQLGEGAPPLVHIASTHPLTIALAEIAAGKIKAILPQPGAVSAAEAAALEEANIGAELGLLLPALEESDDMLVGVADVVDVDDHIAPEVDDTEVMSLSDLVDSEDETETIEPEDDTLSLSDIEDQETTLEDDNPAEE